MKDVQKHYRDDLSHHYYIICCRLHWRWKYELCAFVFSLTSLFPIRCACAYEYVWMWMWLSECVPFHTKWDIFIFVVVVVSYHHHLIRRVFVVFVHAFFLPFFPTFHSIFVLYCDGYHTHTHTHFRSKCVVHFIVVRIAHANFNISKLHISHPLS